VLTVVNDTAPGRAAGREGIGLRNVRERLAVQLGRGARLDAGPEPDDVEGAARWRSAILLPALRELPATRREPG
jgi:signal transduction histidine kinase